MIVFLTKDLMIQSNAAAAARLSDTTTKAMANLAEAMAWVTEHPESLLLVDLQMPGLDLGALLERVAEFPAASLRAIAFAQHVEVDLIEKARGSGFEAVMTRGQFSRSLPEIVKQYAAGISS